MKLKKPPPIWLMSLTARQLRPDHPAKPHRLAADKQIGEEAGREFGALRRNLVIPSVQMTYSVS